MAQERSDRMDAEADGRSEVAEGLEVDGNLHKGRGEALWDGAARRMTVAGPWRLEEFAVGKDAEVAKALYPIGPEQS